MRRDFLEQGEGHAALSTPKSHRCKLMNVAEVADNTRMVGERLVVGAFGTYSLRAVKRIRESPFSHLFQKLPKMYVVRWREILKLSNKFKTVKKSLIWDRG